MSETLIIGTASSGKTILVRQLRQLTEKQPTKKKKTQVPAVSFVTKPTIGVELDTLCITKKVSTTLREVGSSMAPMWSSYHKGCTSVIFLVDSSNHSMLPEAAVELWQTLESENIENKPILVLASKIDVPSLLSEADLLQYLKVTEAQESYSSTIDMM